jgi:hypothetical protein
MKICGQPHDFTNKDYDKIKKDVIVSRFHINKLSGLNPSKDVLHSTFPEWKDELEKSLKDLTLKLQQQG